MSREERDEKYQAAFTRAVRAADERFEKVGGSSRHWIRDCFQPALEAEGLVTFFDHEIDATAAEIARLRARLVLTAHDVALRNLLRDVKQHCDLKGWRGRAEMVLFERLEAALRPGLVKP